MDRFKKKFNKKLEIVQKDGDQTILNIKDLYLNQYNIIYGNNGSGKTSFSRFFNNIKKCSKDNSNDYLSKNYEVIRFGDRDFSLNQLISEYEGTTRSLAIFNSDYIEKNVFITSSNSKKSSKSIVILGEDMNEELKNKGVLEKQKKDLEEKSWYQNDYAEPRDRIKKIYSDLSDYAKNIKINFGFKDHEFTKKNLEDVLKNKNLNSIKSYDDYQKKLEEFNFFQKNPKSEINLNLTSTLPLLFSDNFIAKVKSILGQEVLGKTLDELKNKPDLLDWFTKGYNLHDKHKNSNECKYCKQKIPENRLQEIKNHFQSNISETQNQCQEALNELDNDITKINNFLLQFGLKINSSDSFEDKFKSQLYSTKNYDVCRPKLKIWCDEFNNLCTKIKSQLINKKDNPYNIDNEDFDISSLAKSLTEVINNIQENVINNHNNFINEIKNTKENLINYMVFHLKTPDDANSIEQNLNNKACELNEYLNSISANRKIQTNSIQDFINNNNILEEIKEEIKKNKSSIDNKLKDVDEKLKEIKKGLDEMNKIIKRIVGDKFTLIAHDDGYTVDRSTKCLSTLSEGEKTILAIAHFFSNLKSKEYQHTYPTGKIINKENLTLIIDDPISSLDETNIFRICGYIWEFLKNNKKIQFIILTHRFYVGKIFTQLFKDYPNANLFIMKNGSIQQSNKFKKIFFDDEYRHLFKQVIDWKNDLSSINEANKYIVANVCRKVLEAFSYFKTGGNTDKLFKEYKSEIDQTLVIANTRSTNNYSHLRINTYEDLDEDIAKKMPQDVCEIIKNIDNNHFNSF
jgi:wobble nucleotide-excising tRNase